MDAMLPSAPPVAARHLAAFDPRRWRHVQAVARRAESLADRLVEVDREPLVAAAWLHDVGYAPNVAATGFHALDGGRYLRHIWVEDRVVALVAYHSGALHECEVRGLDAELVREFPREESLTADALWYCDMTTGPNGERVTTEQRLREIRARMGLRTW